MRITSHGWLIAAVLSFTTLAGCAQRQPPPPERELARAEWSVEQAENAEAREFAPLALREAEQKLSDAQRAMQAEEYGLARQLAEQAEASAQVAVSEAEAVRTEQLAEETLRGIDTLRKELELSQEEATR